jgi:hypothetical protein
MPRRRWKLSLWAHRRVIRTYRTSSSRGRRPRLSLQRSPQGHGRHLLGQSAPALPGGICLSGMAVGGPPMTASDAGPKMARSNRPHGTCRASSTLKDLSIGASWASVALSCGPLGPPLADRWVTQRVPNRARRRRRPGARLWTCRSCEVGS